MAQGMDLITRKGYHGTGLKQILDAVKVPKGSFYNYFSSKEDFVAQIIQQYNRSSLARADAYLSSTRDDPITALHTLFTAAADRIEAEGTQGCLAGNLAAELGDTIPACSQALKDGALLWRSRLTDLIQKAQDQGLAKTEIRAELLADMLWDLWQGSLLRIHIDHRVADIRTMVSAALDLIRK